MMNHLSAAPFVKICGQYHATAAKPIALPANHNAGPTLCLSCKCVRVLSLFFKYLCIVIVVFFLLTLLHVAPGNAQQK